jgi:hypothetical protein
VDGDADVEVVDVVLEVQGQGHHGKTSGLKKLKISKNSFYYITHTATHTSTHTPTHPNTPRHTP